MESYFTMKHGQINKFYINQAFIELFFVSMLLYKTHSNLSEHLSYYLSIITLSEVFVLITSIGNLFHIEKRLWNLVFLKSGLYRAFFHFDMTLDNFIQSKYVFDLLLDYSHSLGCISSYKLRWKDISQQNMVK